MVRRMYCIYDMKSEAPVNQIFQCFSTDEDASRMFHDVVMSPNAGLVHKHPGDFALLFVGEIDFDSLAFKPNNGTRFNPVMTGDACVRAERARAAEIAQSESESAEVRDLRRA